MISDILSSALDGVFLDQSFYVQKRTANCVWDKHQHRLHMRPIRAGVDDRLDPSHVQFHYCRTLASAGRTVAKEEPIAPSENAMHSQAGGLLAHFSAEPFRLSYTQALQASPLPKRRTPRLESP